MAIPKTHEQSTGESEVDKADLKCELKIWHLRHKKDGSKEKSAAPSLSHFVEQGVEQYALVIERELDDKNRLVSSTLQINSPQVLQAFREVIGTHPSVATDFSERFLLNVPSEMLFHCWDDLESYKERLDDDVARMHLNLLLHFMEYDMGADKRNFEAQLRSGLVEFPRLGILFRPGDIVIHHVKSQPWLLKILKTAFEENHSEGKYVEVHCSYSDYDGTNFGECKRIFRILQKQTFAQHNPAKVTDLVVYPRALFSGDDGLEERLRIRGDCFLSFTDVSTRQYNGPSEYLKKPPFNYFDPREGGFPQVWLPHHETGRVIVDRKTYEEDHYKGAVMKKPRELLDKTLCPPFVLGYSCGRKEWCRFYLQHLKDISWNDDVFVDLVLPENQLSLIRALVSSHRFPDNARDEMQQKGKGLVCLFHGPPGSGKTLTAECAAELTHKALFSTSMSELNKFNSASYFERRLADVLRLATTWKAVVLLDEADVFLEARRDESPDAAERNALVAVFLRHLEYFSGIVILTTNRIHVFDAAMKSRVHLAIGYKEPDDSTRRLIWSQHLDKVPAEDKGSDIEQALDELASERLNGREISNAINTACTLARYSSVPLQLAHIQQVLGVRRDFDMTLKHMRMVKMSGASGSSSHKVPPTRQGSILSEEPEDMTK